MIKTLYKTFQHWSAKGSVYIISDTHFEDVDCKLMDEDWITPEEQVNIINQMVHKNDTLIHLGDVGNPEWIKKLKAGHKVLIMGNHDSSATKFEPYFDEIYQGILFISEKILLSHEPIYGLEDICLNIHGHNHSGYVYECGKFDKDKYEGTITHINLAANVCGYKPMSLSKIINNGYLSSIPGIHRKTIDNATENSINPLKHI